MTIRRLGKWPYNNYLTYAPRLSKKENRYVLSLIHVNDPHDVTCTSYARYLYQTYHQTILSNTEFVDHIDGDKTHDKIDNYQILTKSQNSKKAVKQLGLNSSPNITFKCVWCETIFKKTSREAHNKRKSYSCSRECSGKFQHFPDGPDRDRRIAENIVSREITTKLEIAHKFIIEDWRLHTYDIQSITYSTSGLVMPSREDILRDAHITSNNYSTLSIKYKVSDHTIKDWICAYSS